MGRPATYDSELRERLVQSAAAAIAEAGVETLSLRSVATAAGTSTNAVYTLIGSKQDLIDAVVAYAVSSFSEAQSSISWSDSPLDDLSELGRAYRLWALAEPALYQIMFGGRTKMAFATDFDSLGRGLGAITEGVERAYAAGYVTDLDNVNEVATILWSTVHGYVSLEIAQWDEIAPPDREQLFHDMQRVLIHRWFEAPVPTG